MEERDEATVRSMSDWLTAEGIKGWSMRVPRPGEKVDIELDWGSRQHKARIQEQFGDAVSITVLSKEESE
jgi:hypothetical protein